MLAPAASRGGASRAENLVICHDGTGNQISENISNVLKLSLPAQDRQDAAATDGALRSPGVGTVTAPVNSTARVLTMH
jgi:uncharacterized protein (DUF2235 family)